MIKILETKEVNNLDMKDLPTELHLPVILTDYNPQSSKCQQRVVRYIREDLAEKEFKKKAIQSFKSIRKHLPVEPLLLRPHKNRNDDDKEHN